MQVPDVRQRKTYARLPWDVLLTYVIIFHEIFLLVEANNLLGNDAGFCQHYMSNIFDITFWEYILTPCQNKKADGAFLFIHTPSAYQE